MPQRSFEEQLRDKSKEFTLQPKEGLWEAVSAQLEPEKKKKRAAFLLPLVMCMAVIVAGIWYAEYINDAKARAGIARNEKAAAGPEEPSGHSSPQAVPRVVVTQANTAQASQAAQPSPEAPAVKSGKSADPAMPAQPRENMGLLSHQDKTGRRSPETIEGSEEKTIAVDVTPVREVIEGVKTQDILLLKESGSNDLPLIDSGVLAAMPAPVKPRDTPVLSKSLPPVTISVKRTYIEFMTGAALSGSWVHTSKSYRNSPDYESQAVDRRKTDKKSWNFNAGLQLGIERKKFSFSAGLHYQALSYRVYVMNISRNMINAGLGTSSFDYNATDSFAMARQQSPIKGVGTYVTNHFDYLAVAVSFVYKLKSTGRFNAGIGATASPQFLLAYNGLFYQQSSGYYVKEKSAVENNIRKMNLSLRADMMFSYRFGSSSALIFNPYYGRSLFAAERSAINTGHVFMGFSAGFRKYF